VAYGIFFWLFIRGPSVLDNYRIKSEIVERPSWWLNAVKNSKITGQDGCSSIVFENSALWIFGDTLLNCTECGWGWKMISNTALIITFKNGTVDTAFYPTDQYGYATEVVPYQSDEDPSKFGIWPGAGLTVGNLTYVFWETINRGNGPWGFSHYAYGKGVWNPSTFNFSRVHPDDTTSQVQVNSPILSQDGQNVYVFAPTTDKIQGTVVARTSVKDFQSRVESYSFWDGSSFSATFSGAKKIYYGQELGSVIWNPFLKQYLMLIAGQTFGVLTAPNVWGPWSHTVSVLQLPSNMSSALVYATYWHPELWRENGRVMVFTFCLTEGDPLPYMVEISLSEI